MNILVTGGAGFIGSHVVDRLVARDHDVVVLDNLDPQVHGDGAGRGGTSPKHIAGHMAEGRVEFVHGDVRDADTVSRALDTAGGVEAVAHLAAAVGVGQSMYEPHYYTSVNVDGQGVLMQAMTRDPERFRRFVVASSMSIYGEGAYRCEAHGEVAPPPRDETRLAVGDWGVACPECGKTVEPVRTDEDKPLQFTSVYAISKKTQEELALCWGRAYEVPTVALRFFNTYGSRQALSNPYTGVAAIFMGRLKNGNPPLVFEDGAQSRDFIHVYDVADSVVAALENDARPGAYNVCTGRQTTIGQVAETLAERLGVDLSPELVGRYRAGDIRHCFGEPARARDALGFEAERDFAEGVDELLAWAEDEDARDRVEASMKELERSGLVR